MEVKQIIYPSITKELNQKGMVKIAVNAFGNTDSDGDVSLPGSFRKTLKEHFGRVRWFLNHDTTKLLGVPIKGYEEGDHLVMEAQFNLAKQIAIDTYEDYKLYQEHGKSLEHSIGVNAMKWSLRSEDGMGNPNGQIREVSEWKLWEFSTLTHWGANENTPLLGIKSKDDLKRLLEEMGNNTRYSDERKKDIEQTQKALLVEPTRITPDMKAATKTIMRLVNFDVKL